MKNRMIRRTAWYLLISILASSIAYPYTTDAAVLEEIGIVKDSILSDSKDEKIEAENEKEDTKDAKDEISEDQISENEIPIPTVVVTINNEEDFLAFSKKCSLDSWSLDKLVYLNADIDLKKIDFDTIPTFGGYFYGEGHTITGLYMKSEGSNVGLFKYIQPSGRVENLKLEGDLCPTGTQKIIGGIAARNDGAIYHCSFKGLVDGIEIIGGISGINGMTGLILSCDFEGSAQGRHMIGGIAGENLGVIRNCSNKAKINTETEENSLSLKDINLENITSFSTMEASDVTDIGGITGYSIGEIYDCSNDGMVGYPHVGYNIGGIVGRQSGYMESCMNYGEIHGRKDVGGIVGQMEPYGIWNYSESTVTKLQTELSVLHSMIGDTLDDADETSTLVTNQLNVIDYHADAAESAANSLADQTGTLINENVKSINELSQRIHESIATLSQITTKASASLTTSTTAISNIYEFTSDQNNGINNHLDAGHRKNKEGVQKLKHALEQISNNQISGNQVSGDVIKELTEAADDFAQAASELQLAFEHTEAYLRDNQDFKSLINSSKSMAECATSLGDMLITLSNKPKITFYGVDDNYIQTRQALSTSMSGLTTGMNQLNQIVSVESDILIQDFRNVNDQLFLVFDLMSNAVLDAEDDNIERHIEDISEEEAEESMEGKVYNCGNNGPVEADINVGGITGSMMVENDYDLEDDLSLSGKIDTGAKYMTTCILMKCVNNGTVISKKNCAGGIVGKMELGYLSNSYGYGKVSSSGGDYVGGITGYSETTVNRCWSKVNLSGGNDIGGIVGYSNGILKNNYSLIRIEQGKEFLGAIAGCSEGTLEGNYFVHDELAGVDKISLQGKAEPITYEQLLMAPMCPMPFTVMRVQFIVDDEVIKEMSTAYGMSLNPSDIPEVPKKEGSQGSWSDEDFESLTYDKQVRAEYRNFVTTLSSIQMRDQDKPAVLVEGEFHEKDTLLTEQIHKEADVYANQMEHWHITIPEDGLTEHIIRYRAPETGKNEKLCFYVGDDKCDAVLSGSYWLIRTDLSDLDLIVVKERSLQIWYVAAGMVLLILLGLLAVYLHKSRNHRHKMKEEKERNLDLEIEAVE